MKLAIMQPYIFPYIGYYQLIHSVDKIVMYDDVNFIKQGWINRNRILLNRKDFLFTIPLKDISSFKHIKDTLIDEPRYQMWVQKFFVTLTQAYKRAPYYNEVFKLMEGVLETSYQNISQLATESLKATCLYVGLKTKFVDSSDIYNNKDLKSQERVLDICRKENAKKYINASGGQQLYSKEEFAAKGIQLNFLLPRLTKYQQTADEFFPGLSIIDVLMYNNVETVSSFIENYDLI